MDGGTLAAIPIIPSKAAMIGNSLLLGNGTYGMAASDDEHDYYYYITKYIQSLNSSYTASRIRGWNYEAIDKEANINTYLAELTNQLDGDEDLVSIQIGDNVVAANLTVFNKSAKILCKAVRQKCPKARVVWMGLWYGTTEKYGIIQSACKETGCRFISLRDIKEDSDSKSYIGAVCSKEEKERTISDVSKVVENSKQDGLTNITVTFTVSSTEYTSTLDVTSYSLEGGVLTYNSGYEIITNGTVAGHPGDNGFRMIANKFLYEMGLTDDEEYYKE
jgi:hypothetical protein